MSIRPPNPVSKDDLNSHVPFFIEDIQFTWEQAVTATLLSVAEWLEKEAKDMNDNALLLDTDDGKYERMKVWAHRQIAAQLRKEAQEGKDG